MERGHGMDESQGAARSRAGGSGLAGRRDVGTLAGYLGGVALIVYP